MRPEREAADVVRHGLVRAVQPAERVAEVDARHRPLRRELERDRVRREAPFEVAARALHDRVVEVRLRAARDGLARRVPEGEVVRVVVRVAARGEALEAEEERRRDATPPPERARRARRAASTVAKRERRGGSPTPIAGKYQKRSARTVGRTTGMFDTGKYETTIHTSATRDQREREIDVPCEATVVRTRRRAACSRATRPARRQRRGARRAGRPSSAAAEDALRETGARGSAPAAPSSRPRASSGKRTCRGRARTRAARPRRGSGRRRVDERVVERIVRERGLRVPAEERREVRGAHGLPALASTVSSCGRAHGEPAPPHLDVEDERRRRRERGARAARAQRRGRSGCVICDVRSAANGTSGTMQSALSFE